MDQDLLRQLPEEYARLADRPGVMREAAEVVAELHAHVTRLGDTIVAAGLPGRAWQSPEADLRLISDRLPDVTLETLIARLAEFAAGSGPDWLHGDRAALARFHEEAADLDTLMRALRVAAQRLRLAPAHERVLPLEAAFSDVRVLAAIEQVSLALGDLVALAPFMGPLTAEQWRSLSSPEPTGQGFAGAESAGQGFPPALNQLGAAAGVSASVAGKTLRLRDYARTAPLDRRPAAGRELIPPTLRRLIEPVRGGVRALARAVHLPARMVAVLGLILLLAAGAGILELARVGQAQPAPPPPAPLAVSPARLALTCGPHGRSTALTLRNTTAGTLSWQARAPTGLAVSPTHGSLAAGRGALLRAAVVSAHLKAGAITITTPRGAVRVPYTTTCR